MSNEDEDEIGVIIKVQLDADTEATIFAAVFKSKEDCLDFLVEQEKNKGMGTASLSF